MARHVRHRFGLSTTRALCISNPEKTENPLVSQPAKSPQMQLKIGQLTLTGKAQFVTDTAESEKVHDLFRSKYALARAAGFVGSSIGHGEVILVEHLTEAVPPE